MHHTLMEQTDDIVLLHKSQGSINCLRKLKMLRDKVTCL